MKAIVALDPTADYRKSSLREKMLEHVFVSELLQEAWFYHHRTLEVLHSPPIGIILSPALGALFMSVSTIEVALNAQLLRGLKLAEPRHP